MHDHPRHGNVRIDYLREAIQSNRIHFPMPVPIFQQEFRADIQWRLVELYFVRGWSTRRLAERYGVTTRRVQQSLLHWVGRAAERGYLQEIPDDSLHRAPSIASPHAAPVQMPSFVPIPIAAVAAYAAQPT